VVKAVFARMEQSLRRGERIEIRGFGAGPRGMRNRRLMLSGKRLVEPKLLQALLLRGQVIHDARGVPAHHP